MCWREALPGKTYTLAKQQYTQARGSPPKTMQISEHKYPQFSSQNCLAPAVYVYVCRCGGYPGHHLHWALLQR